MTKIKRPEQLAGLLAVIADSKDSAERARHDLADALARIEEAERLIREFEALDTKERNGAVTQH